MYCGYLNLNVAGNGCSGMTGMGVGAGDGILHPSDVKIELKYLDTQMYRCLWYKLTTLLH
mgnify:CR=1 FL=1